MIHLCIFSGHNAPLAPGRRVYLTVFGGADLSRPTLAKQMIERFRRQQAGDTVPGHFFITLFGGVSIKVPTLAEEFLDLQHAVRGGQLTLTQWDQALAEVGHYNVWPLGSLTLFGGYDAEELPSENTEVEQIAQSRHLGYLSDEAATLLAGAIGTRGTPRGTVVRQAVATSMAPDSVER
ncbi:MAG: hypothetical protein PVJ57_06420 [Phycisphaerae bacterium]|jgi:hypothetical protein